MIKNRAAGVVWRPLQDVRADLSVAGAEHDPLTGDWRFPGTCDGCGYRSTFLVSMGIGGLRCEDCRREARKHAPKVVKA